MQFLSLLVLVTRYLFRISTISQSIPCQSHFIVYLGVPFPYLFRTRVYQDSGVFNAILPLVTLTILLRVFCITVLIIFTVRMSSHFSSSVMVHTLLRFRFSVHDQLMKSLPGPRDEVQRVARLPFVAGCIVRLLGRTNRHLSTVVRP